MAHVPRVEHAPVLHTAGQRSIYLQVAGCYGAGFCNDGAIAKVAAG